VPVVRPHPPGLNDDDGGMRFAIDIAPLGDLADPGTIAELGRAAEAAGWDGLSIWDSLGVDMGTVAPDPFVALAAVAAATTRLRLILCVAVLSRRRPQLVAQSAGTLDRLSGGRLTLGVGAGGDPGDLSMFGEGAPMPELVERTDAALAVIEPWLRGQAAQAPGEGAQPVVVGPRSIQRPRPPIWFGGMKPAAMRRAARLEGWSLVGTTDDGSGMALTPADVAERVARVRAERATLGLDGSFDVSILGRSDLLAPGAIQAYASAGITWWLESLSRMRAPIEGLRAIVEAGPQRI
jgi:alkanesulfonate monooxygenase SsuD/methylene tetrahydromethanopterin reductase-like flavin-dependent oxidoreductase (luciferase family)